MSIAEFQAKALWQKSVEEEYDALGGEASRMTPYFLPGLPVDAILACYAAAPGNELVRGKLSSPVSSAALAANAFGFFLQRPADLPILPGVDISTGPAQSVTLEAEVRFPWRGGKHPWLDVLVTTPGTMIGIESKRYEPFRSKPGAKFSAAYFRQDWGEAMHGFSAARNALVAGTLAFKCLDAAQLIKHAYGLRSATQRTGVSQSKAILYYLYAEPDKWQDGRPVCEDRKEIHRFEIGKFAALVSGDEVAFRACSYGDLLRLWHESPLQEVSLHAGSLNRHFDL